jgi:hypothetical protein
MLEGHPSAGGRPSITSRREDSRVRASRPAEGPSVADLAQTIMGTNTTVSGDAPIE